jgi:hypothetical protein
MNFVSADESFSTLVKEARHCYIDKIPEIPDQ